MKYKNIVKAIFKKAKEENIDYRELIRQWIMLFEETRVVGWSRDEFLDCCVEETKRRQNGKKAKRLGKTRN